jgi:DNA-binding LacI/PurR family transcriptional regulator
MQERLSRQLATTFREKIRSGEWASGDRLPTTRQLAATYQVSLNTVQSAFQELESHDLVVRHPRRGGFVKGSANGGKPSTSRATNVYLITPQPSADEPREWHGWSDRILRAAERELARHDFHVSLSSVPSDDRPAIARLLSRLEEVADDLAGVICLPFPNSSDLLELLDQRDIAWVTINRSSESALHNFVTADNYHGGRLVGRCFATSGLDRVVVLGLPLSVGVSTGEKFFGFMHGYIESGQASRNVDYLMCRTFHEIHGYEQLSMHVQRHGPPRDIFAAGDLLALGAIRYCREHDLSIPEQVAVVGSTGLEIAEYAHPSITVLEQPSEEMGRQSAQMLLGMIRNRARRVLGKYIASPLTIRQSFVIPQDVVQRLQVNRNAVPVMNHVNARGKSPHR